MYFIFRKLKNKYLGTVFRPLSIHAYSPSFEGEEEITTYFPTLHLEGVFFSHMFEIL